jgi:CspA family cold shock protein
MDGFRTLNEGDRVSFEVVDGPKGLQARNVMRV